MATILKPPAPIRLDPDLPSVFLAGSIEMGAAEDWQQAFERAFEHDRVTILNPRRDDWDSSWEQSIHNRPFREQVEWELLGLERATAIAMNFVPGTKSPVTLLELGLVAQSGRLVVCCPDGFWRKGNVEVVCAKHNVPTAANPVELIALIRSRISI